MKPILDELAIKVAEQLIKDHKDFSVEGFSEYMNGYFNGAIEGYKKASEVKYKPLSELMDSEEDCKKIFNFVTNGFGDNPITNIEYRDDCVLIESRKPSDDGIFIRGVFIIFDGFVEHYNYHEEDLENRDPDLFFDRHDNPIENIFELVDFIRNLGYDVKE